MSTWKTGNRPITIAVLAMGGEGGGVLSGWIADVATRAGYAAQTSQVAGVAQRTGSTVYYIELMPPTQTGGADGARGEPVLSLFPIPGECDIVIASELMESARAVQRGFVTPDRTTLITSTNRVYSIDEKSIVGDGRVDPESLLASAAAGAKRVVAADFMAMAVSARSVISASLLGALAGSGSLPFEKDDYKAAIEAAGKGVNQSLDAFERGFATSALAIESAETAEAQQTGVDGAGTPTKRAPVFVELGRRPTDEEDREKELVEQAANDPQSLIGPKLQKHAARIKADFPAAARLMLVRGCLRTALYQSDDYALTYLDRVARVLPVDGDKEGDAALTVETARYAALMMTYQDTIHVALQKIRAKRLADIREEARAEEDQLVDVYEYLHPEVEEVTDTMPSGMGRRLRDSRLFGKAVKGVGGKGVIINTTSVAGFTTLATLAGMRPMRPSTMRFKRVQKEVDAWIDLATKLGASDPALALEVIKAAHVIKGYGETHERGMRSFNLLLEAAQRLFGREDAAASVARMREAALRDEEGEALRKEFDAVLGA